MFQNATIKSSQPLIAPPWASKIFSTWITTQTKKKSAFTYTCSTILNETISIWINTLVRFAFESARFASTQTGRSFHSIFLGYNDFKFKQISPKLQLQFYNQGLLTIIQAASSIKEITRKRFLQTMHMNKREVQFQTLHTDLTFPKLMAY